MPTMIRCPICRASVPGCDKHQRRHHLMHATKREGQYAQCFGRPEGSTPITDCEKCILRPVCHVTGHLIHQAG